MSDEKKADGAEEKSLENVTADFKELSEKSEKLAEENKKLESERANFIANATAMKPGNDANSDESKALRYFGCRHVKDLMKVNTGAAEYKHVPDSVKWVVRNMKETLDVARFTAQRFRGGSKDVFGAGENSDYIPAVPTIYDTNYGKDVLIPRLKAFDSTVGSTGGDWVPTNLSESFIEEFELERKVEGQFRMFNMTSQPWELPVQDSVTQAKAVAEGAAATQDNFTTTKLTFTATKFQEFYILPEELNEDSAPPILALARREVVESQERAQETAILNGDNDGTHQDSDTEALGSEVAEKQYDGLRKLAIANSGAGGTETFTSAVTTAKLRDMIKNMGKFGVNPRDLVWFASPNAYQQMAALDEVSTFEKFGNAFTIRTGALAIFQGISIVISEFMRDDLNASGVFDNSVTDNTAILLVNWRRFYMGQRRPIRVRVLQDPRLEFDRWLLSSYSRKDFQGHTQSSSEVSVVYGIDITA